MNWRPSDITRLVALIGALALFIIGALMMRAGIAAEGAIDVSSAVLSGSIKTGSAGLFVVFLSFLMIAFVLLTLDRKDQGSAGLVSHKSSRRLGHLVWGLLAAVVVTGSLGGLGYGKAFGGLAVGLGMLLYFALMFYIAMLGDE